MGCGIFYTRNINHKVINFFFNKKLYFNYDLYLNNNILSLKII